MSEHDPTPRSEPPAGERRAYVRLASALSATCRWGGRSQDVGWPARVRNVSRGGIGLLLRHCFRPGTSLIVELRDEVGRPLGTVSVRVIHATAVAADGGPRWLLGCAFEQSLTDEEWQALG